MKKQIKIIGDIVKDLPQKEYASYARQSEPVKGEQLIKDGHTHVEGQPIIPTKTYYQRPTIKNEVNHKRRAVRAFKKHGVEGFFKYIDPFLIPEKRDGFKERLTQALS